MSEAAALPAPGFRFGLRGLFWPLALAATVAIALWGPALLPDWAVGYPGGWELPLARWVKGAMDWLLREASFGLFTFQELTRGVAWLLASPLTLATGLFATGLERGEGSSAVLILPPLSWLAVVILAVALGRWARDWRLGLLAGGCFLYLALFGQWQSAMVTLSSIAIAVPFGVAGGLLLGIAGHRWRWFEAGLRPLLDLMQTVPIFAYLVPILFLFGFGPVAAMIATIIYAMPPMVRVTLLALRQVPAEIVDFGRMAGCTRRQLTWKVLVPSARPQLMLGVNQVIMLSLNMVIIASMIGAGGLGFDVLNALRRLDIGAGLEAGLAIVALAIALDRVSQALAQRQASASAAPSPVIAREARSDAALSGRGIGSATAELSLPGLTRQSRVGAWRTLWMPGSSPGMTRNGIAWQGRRGWVLVALVILGTGLIGLILPAVQTYPEALQVTTAPFWDRVVEWLNVNFFDDLEAVKNLVLLNLLIPFKRFLLALPWPWVVGLLAVAAFRLGGLRLALLVVPFSLFIAVTGQWQNAMVTLYLMTVSVIVAALIGIPIGIAAAGNERLWRVVQATVDVLQTLPSFVYLIPVVMLFQVGDFTAMIAIVAYAVAPAVRYTAFGIRQVDGRLVEAGVAAGCTRRQLLWKIRLPLALPQILLGVNQTIMLALSMLVITALVGTRDLGQEVYVALTRADPGRGLVAGLCVAAIAITADRLFAAGTRRTQARLGLL